MPKKGGMKYMMAFVEEYLNGEMDLDRLGFDLDFIHYLSEHYPKMERENAELAKCFAFYLDEQGFSRTKGMSNAEHKELIRKQYEEFKSVMNDGLY